MAEGLAVVAISADLLVGVLAQRQLSTVAADALAAEVSAD
jgi:hypothetical protein